jgi:hypothetical protein
MSLETSRKPRQEQAGIVFPNFFCTHSPQRRRWAVVTLLALAALAFGSNSARADFIFTLGNSNSAISGFPNPYGQVDVHLVNSQTATVTLTSLTAGGNIYLFGGNSTFAFNVNAASWTLGTISGSNSGTGFTPGGFSDGGAKNVSTFGFFNQTIDTSGGFTHSSDKVSFTLTDTSGTWASASDVLARNASGVLAAGHVFVTSSPANAANGAINTGYVATPEPTSLALLGFGAAGLVGYAWRRRNLAVAKSSPSTRVRA